MSENTENMEIDLDTEMAEETCCCCLNNGHETMEEDDEISEFNCGHNICISCFGKYIKPTKLDCPICRCLVFKIENSKSTTYFEPFANRFGGVSLRQRVAYKNF